ncbi:MAG: hypothetical protein K2X87_25330 [Gemmataceae bacterium]|nr:hypothetical protein [Gemmataceae bacterium]
MRKTLAALALVALLTVATGCRLFRRDDHPSNHYFVPAAPAASDPGTG